MAAFGFGSAEHVLIDDVKAIDSARHGRTLTVQNVIQVAENIEMSAVV